MRHDYKLGDFKNRFTKPAEADIKEINVTISLIDASDLPSILIERLEAVINAAIDEREQEINGEIPLEDMNMESYLNVCKTDKELTIEVYIGYSITEDLIYSSEVITADDEHYSIFRKYFFDKLNILVSEQIRRIEECV